MDCDQAYQGQLDHSFPSPGSTPTSTEFPGNHAHQTPKTTIFPTYFQDAFSTPQIPSYGTPQQQQNTSITPKHYQQSSTDTLRSNFYANAQTQNSQPGILSSIQTSSQHGSGQWDHQHQMIQPQSSMDLSQMQTPPPTRGSSSKKMAAPSDQIAFGTPSTIASRRFTTPQHQHQASSNTGNTFQTPVQFPQLQFSPDLYQMSNQGPATAPVLTQSRLLWEQQTSPINNFTQQSMMEDPFSTPISQDMSWLTTSMGHSNVQAFSFDTPAMNSFPVQAPHPRPASTTQLSSVPNLQPPAMSQPVSSGVNPSLLYTSPAQVPSRSNSRAGKAQPTAKENRRDSALVNKNRAASYSKADGSSTRPEPALRRSNTTESIRPGHAQPTANTAQVPNRTSSFAHPPRTASPLKRIGRTPLGSISETSKPRQRPSVTLVVDENGRARTETVKPPESPTTKSMRERYPGLWDSDSSDEESDDGEQSLSRVPSFSFGKGEERRQKTARLDPPIENLEGLSIPRSSSSASVRATPSKAAMSAAAQLRRQSSARKVAPARRTSVRKNPGTKSTTSLIDTAPMDMSSEQPTAAAAQQKPQRSQNNPNDLNQTHNTQPHELSAIEAHNRRWESMSAEQTQKYPPQAPFYNNAPPPSSLGSSQPFAMPPQAPPLQIRCVCGVSDVQGQPLIQSRTSGVYLLLVYTTAAEAEGLAGWVLVNADEAV
ncbi:hypothetical protein MBLNU230_g7401t1 [Neophaeotheca triangularis]